MRELAVRGVDVAELVEDREDFSDLPVQQAVGCRPPARRSGRRRRRDDASGAHVRCRSAAPHKHAVLDLIDAAVSDGWSFDRVWGDRLGTTARLIAVGLLESGRPGCGPRA